MLAGYQVLRFNGWRRVDVSHPVGLFDVETVNEVVQIFTLENL